MGTTKNLESYDYVSLFKVNQGFENGTVPPVAHIEEFFARVELFQIKNVKMIGIVPIYKRTKFSNSARVKSSSSLIVRDAGSLNESERLGPYVRLAPYLK